MSASNNVIQFPRQNEHVKCHNGYIVTKESVDMSIENVKQYHIQETIEIIAPQIFNQFEMAGFNLAIDGVDVEADIKDGAFLIEAMRSLLCKYYGIHHPFQQIAEEVFSVDQNETPGVLKIANSLNIELKANSDK